MKVTITIETGNAAMRTERDVARALTTLAKRIKDNGLDFVTKVMDDNGQSVGTVTVER